MTRPTLSTDGSQPSLASDAEAAKRYFGSFADDYQPVSYTHLTLPTILRV